MTKIAWTNRRTGGGTIDRAVLMNGRLSSSTSSKLVCRVLFYQMYCTRVQSSKAFWSDGFLEFARAQKANHRQKLLVESLGSIVLNLWIPGKPHWLVKFAFRIVFFFHPYHHSGKRKDRFPRDKSDKDSWAELSTAINGWRNLSKLRFPWLANGS